MKLGGAGTSSSSSSTFLLYFPCMALAVLVRRAAAFHLVVQQRAAATASSKSSSILRSSTTTSLSSTMEASTMTTSPAAASYINPFLQMDNLPKFSALTPADLTPAVQTLLEKMERDFVALEEKLASSSDEAATCVSYDQVLPEIEKMQFPIGYVWGVAGHLNGVQNGEALRQAYEQNQPQIVQAFSKFSQSKPLYDALSKLELPPNDDDDFVTAQKRRAIDLSLRSMKLGGVGLTGADQTRFNEIKMRLASLSTSFSNHVLDETKAYSLLVDGADALKLASVPESARAMWAQAAGGDATAAAGPYKITLDMPSYLAVLSHVPDRDIRQKVYLANISRASEQNPEKNNIPLIKEILSLKQEMASLLGYDHYAALSLASKMAPSIDAVRELSDLIAAQALPAAQAELAAITELAHASGMHPLDEPLRPWDTTYWSERLKESKYDLTEEETRPYFALPKVLEGMFALVDRLFQITVEASDGEADVWHPDVRFFKVYDNSNPDGDDQKRHIASFFLDPYSRPADKRGGAWMDVCIGKSEAVARDIPVAYLTCNGSPPVGTEKPSLMTFREVETLFHEFGHGLQHMLTKASVGDVAGINGIEWDAVELPSQFMENWCYDRPTVYGFAKHWQTGESMPDEMFEKLKAQKTFNAGMMSCRQLLFGQVDLELHSTYDPNNDKGETVFDVHRRTAEKYTPYLLPIPEDRFLCAFSHIFAGGYSAGYYSYKWAEVMSADAFSAFEEAGLDDEAAVRTVGRKFRDTVLSLGGGVDPNAVFAQFRGRSPQPDALLRHNGLA